MAELTKEPSVQTITLTIDGKTCEGVKGQTILEVARANGIEIPTLCHHKWLTRHGGCRMCVVEVEGSRKLVTSCAAPAEDGQVVTAHNERLAERRAMTLELLFAERNHICPYCPATGNCELQAHAYDHGITHTRYQYIFPVLQPDTTNEYFVHDPNRCILCGRCVRACSEVAGVGTLGFGFRGSEELVLADLGVPLGESSCIRCGACVDVCPTGAMFEKRAPYFLRAGQLDRQAYICPDDDLGAAMTVVLKSGLVAGTEGWEDAPVNGALLSWRSRYELLHEPTPRLRKPRLRRDGQLVEVEWDEALAAAAEKVVEATKPYNPVTANGQPHGVVGLCSGRLPREDMIAFRSFLGQTCDTTDVDTFRGQERWVQRAAKDLYGELTECDFDAIQDADMVLVVGFDPPATHPVLGAWLARKVHLDQVPMVSINAREAAVATHSVVSLKPRRGAELSLLYGLLCQLLDVGRLANAVDSATAEKWRSHPAQRVAVEARVDADDIKLAAKLYARAKKPVILYGPGLLDSGNPTLIGRLWEMARYSGHTTESGALRVRGFRSEANAAAAEAVGFLGADLETAAVAWLLAGDDNPQPAAALAEQLRRVPTVIVQASHEGPLLDYADIVLPSFKWSERGGTWVNVTGLEQSFDKLTEPPAGIVADAEVFGRMAERVEAAGEAAADPAVAGATDATAVEEQSNG